jgi:hypothetical protein
MKNRSLVAIAIAASIGLMMFFACSQKYQGELLPVQDDSTGKWGYADTTGKSVIAPKWDMAGAFSEGLAAVETDRKWGFVDRDGNEVIAPEWDTAGIFSEGLAAIRLNEKYGFIDKTGNEVIPVKYDRVEPFSGGLSPVELDYMTGVIDTAGKTVVPFQAKELLFEGGSCRIKEFVFDSTYLPAMSFLGDDNMKADVRSFTLSFTCTFNIGVKGNAVKDAVSVLYSEGKFVSPDWKTCQAIASLAGEHYMTYILIVILPEDMDVETLSFELGKQKMPLKPFVKK